MSPEGTPSNGLSSTLPNGMPVTEYRLRNGMKVLIAENHSAPVFSFQLWMNVGSRHEKLDPRLNATGLAHLFEHMMFRGTAKYPDGEYDAVLTRNGANDINATTWFDRTNYYVNLPADRLDLILELESDRMSHLVVDEDLLDTERGAVLGELAMGQDDPDMVAYDKLYATAFTVHPYRFTTIGTEEEIRRFSVEDANYFYRTYYAPNNAVMLIVGDVNPDQAIALVNRHFGDKQPQEIPRPSAPAEPEQTVERQAEFRHRQLIQPKMLLGYHVPGVNHADQAALHVLQAMLTLGRGSLLQADWVNAGLAGALAGSVDEFAEPGLLTIHADLQAGKRPEALIEALERALTRLQSPAFPLGAKVERARNQLLLGIYESWEENSSLANFMGEYIASAGSPTRGFEIAEALERVTEAEVLRVLRRYLVPSNRTIVVGRPAAEGSAQ